MTEVPKKPPTAAEFAEALPWNNNTWEVAAQIAALRRRNSAAVVVPADDQAWLGPIGTPEGPLTLRAGEVSQLLLQTVIVPDKRTSEGILILAVAPVWFQAP